MREIIHLKKLNNAFTSMVIIGVLLACQFGYPLEAKAGTPSAAPQQTSIVWNKLSSVSGAGSTIGAAGTTRYYYVESNATYDASSKAAGTSGLVVNGTVYLFIPSGVTLTCIGAAGNGTTPGGAGIEVNASSSLYILGSGTLSATGGKAGNGGDAENGGNASATSITKGQGGRATLNTGYGGAGGYGGGGAGAGIGTKGATGVSGGSRLAGRSQAFVDATSAVYVNSSNPNNGKDSNASANAGNIYKSETITISAKGGAAGTGGKAGSPGKGWLDCGSGWKWYYSSGAGGGGGGGGSGYAAATIGNGGASGAGGGSGVNGGICGSASVSYCLRNGKGGTGGAGGVAGATASYQTSKVNNTGFVTCSGATNDAAVNKLSIECWGRLSNGSISHGSVSGGSSGAAGAAGSKTEPTTANYNYSVKFLGRDGDTVSQTDYFFSEKSITFPTHCSSDTAIRLTGWKLVDYGNTVSASSDPLTTATPDLYTPGSELQLSRFTYGDITLQAVTEVDYDEAFNHLNDSNYSAEPLNNVVENQNSNGLAQKVTGTDPRTNLKVILLGDTDSVKVYKLADVSWYYTDQLRAKATWNETVTEWFTHSEEYKNSNIASDPLLISDMTENLKSRFFGTLFSDENGVIAGMEPFLQNDQVSEAGGPAENGSYYKLFKNIPTGMYVVTAEGSYSPTVVTIFPYGNGPMSGLYIDSEYTARLKHSAADVEKKINGNDKSDTVAYRDTVEFDIDFKFPSLYSDRVTLKGDGTDTSLDYQLYAEDIMSPAFALINTSTNKPTISYSINGGVTKTPLSSDDYDYYEFADASYTGAGTKELVNDSLVSKYLYNGRALLDELGGEPLYAVKKSAPIYTIGDANVSKEGYTTLNISFNVHALKAFVKDNSIEDLTKFVLTLHYEATVTDKLEIGSDINTNKVILHFEEAPNNMTKAEDEVYGYSYGLQVIKINGTNSTEESTKYLAGAKFKLYKEVEAEPADTPDVYVYEDDDNKVTRYFLPVTDIFTEAVSNLTESGEFTSLESESGIILKGLKEGHYILSETHAPGGFNSLAEDIYFEINKLEKEDAENHYGGKYKIFREMDKEGQEEPIYNESGMVSLSVVNYRGLTLPSTGGTGILLITIIGIAMMLSVIIILIVRRHSKPTSFFM